MSEITSRRLYRSRVLPYLAVCLTVAILGERCEAGRNQET